MAIGLLEKHIALEWFRDLPEDERNRLAEKHQGKTPLTNGCVLRIYKSENK